MSFHLHPVVMQAAFAAQASAICVAAAPEHMRRPAVAGCRFHAWTALIMQSLDGRVATASMGADGSGRRRRLRRCTDVRAFACALGALSSRCVSMRLTIWIGDTGGAA